MVELDRVTKIYRRKRGGADVTALRGVSLSIDEGDFLCIQGASGSGKSTLLHILGCLDRPTSGTYRLAGEELSGYGDRKLSQIRSRRIGFVFQSFHLIPRTTAIENVEVPMIYAGQRIDRLRAQAALERVGLQHRESHFAAELSGGEQQRVAIARALINDPELVLADEPTGNLDSQAGAEVMRILDDLHREGRTIVLVTHDQAIAARSSREVRIADGKVISDLRRNPARADGRAELAGG